MRADPLLLLAAVGLSIFTGILKGWKWQAIMRAEGLHFPVLKCIEVFFIAFFLSILTPGRIGEVARTIYFKGTKPEKILPSVVVDRALDIIILFVLTIASAIAFAMLFGKNVIPIEVLAIVALLLVAVIFLFSKPAIIRAIFRPLFHLIVPEKFKLRARAMFDSFYDSMRKYRQKKRLIFFSVFLGIVAWLLSILCAYILLPALGITEIPFYYTFLVLPIITLVALIPISITGLGTREATVIFLFAIYGVSVEQSVAFSIVFLFVGYISAAVIGLVLFMMHPVDFKKALSSAGEE
jgi:uncharacterized protein (TIRG00374 family)